MPELESSIASGPPPSSRVSVGDRRLPGGGGGTNRGDLNFLAAVLDEEISTNENSTGHSLEFTSSRPFASDLSIVEPRLRWHHQQQITSNRSPATDHSDSHVHPCAAQSQTPETPRATAPKAPRQVVRGRLGGCADFPVSPTAPHAFHPFTSTSSPASVDPASTIRSPEYEYTVESILNPPRETAAAPTAPGLPAAAALDDSDTNPRGVLHHRAQPKRPFASHSSHLLQSAFRSRVGSAQPGLAAASYRPRQPSAARLWNPSNSTPRGRTASRHLRRKSSPPPPPVRLEHPVIDEPGPVDPVQKPVVGDYPLLTLSEQRQSRHSPSTRASLQVERRDSGDQRVSLPRSVRASIEGRRSQSVTPSPLDPANREQAIELEEIPKRLDKGKGRAVMAQDQEEPRGSFARDLERGPDMERRLSNVSIGDGIGSAISSSNSSIMGEEVQADAADEWGPLHACYPHLNPHVPVNSLDYVATRIIRVRRDWLIQGDLAPNFSDLYPEILDPAGISETQFRQIVGKLNSELVPIFDPYSARNIMDGVLGLVTGWLWDDFGLTGVKARLNGLEKWIDKWNQDMARSMGSEDPLMAPKIISLRRTGYLTLDIQIPDPEVEAAPPSSRGQGSIGMPVEPSAMATA